MRCCLSTVLACCLGVLTAAAPILAQGTDTPSLADIQSLKCTFGTSSRVVWKDGVPQPTVRTTSTLNLEIKEIDALGGTAVVSTLSTSNDVNVQVNDKTLTFIEASRAGRLAMTIVMADYSTGRRLKAVHTRTDYLPIDLGPAFRSEPEVSIYAGDCEAVR